MIFFILVTFSLTLYRNYNENLDFGRQIFFSFFYLSATIGLRNIVLSWNNNIPLLGRIMIGERARNVRVKQCCHRLEIGREKNKVTYQTRETVFHQNIQISRRELKIRRAADIFDEIRDVWIANEILSRVFDISSQLKQKLMSKR